MADEGSKKEWEMQRIAAPLRYESVQFELSAEQIERLNQWLEDVNVRAAEKQATMPIAAKAKEYGFSLPYYGAVGGGISFKFVGTGVGVSCKVTESITGETLDLTDYDW